ncbi:hypothetical protein SPRG_06741 [Saprolegnia parasitica CBS 223.65]|uniref:Uncharacterized protein n=1 Tax=Saprolegnia parasitica (strain CBS 223.65) TaxID=695850 RepID=A0A067CNV0_SAPPC|nr:hypothetical protein SPRG_06741 [Saprolegnia parasitica CBS 223.65]KDO28502.1 hypothetical protein SPRG_06741 [Saprolegnia parasitica CBS 223.65]|eukprot:XP_012200938.1 hypothetical protein SPRG_06741 [Saprolegnia parasitica CBS 223.65]
MKLASFLVHGPTHDAKVEARVFAGEPFNDKATASAPALDGAVMAATDDSTKMPAAAPSDSTKTPAAALTDKIKTPKATSTVLRLDIARLRLEADDERHALEGMTSIFDLTERYGNLLEPVMTDAVLFDSLVFACGAVPAIAHRFPLLFDATEHPSADAKNIDGAVRFGQYAYYIADVPPSLNYVNVLLSDSIAGLAALRRATSARRRVYASVSQVEVPTPDISIVALGAVEWQAVFEFVDEKVLAKDLFAAMFLRLRAVRIATAFKQPSRLSALHEWIMDEHREKLRKAHARLAALHEEIAELTAKREGADKLSPEEQAAYDALFPQGA